MFSNISSLITVLTTSALGTGISTGQDARSRHPKPKTPIQKKLPDPKASLKHPPVYNTPSKPPPYARTPLHPTPVYSDENTRKTWDPSPTIARVPGSRNARPSPARVSSHRSEYAGYNDDGEEDIDMEDVEYPTSSNRYPARSSNGSSLYSEEDDERYAKLIESEKKQKRVLARAELERHARTIEERRLAEEEKKHQWISEALKAEAARQMIANRNAKEEERARMIEERRLAEEETKHQRIREAEEETRIATQAREEWERNAKAEERRAGIREREKERARMIEERRLAEEEAKHQRIREAEEETRIATQAREEWERNAKDEERRAGIREREKKQAHLEALEAKLEALARRQEEEEEEEETAAAEQEALNIDNKRSFDDFKDFQTPTGSPTKTQVLGPIEDDDDDYNFFDEPPQRLDPAGQRMATTLPVQTELMARIVETVLTDSTDQQSDSDSKPLARTYNTRNRNRSGRDKKK
jgi:hypothetical protein